jgi:hypothetical protein
MSDDVDDLINTKGELLSNILVNLNKSDSFVCFGVRFSESGDELSFARFGGEEEIVATIAYILADDDIHHLVPAILQMVAFIKKKDEE